MEYYGTSFWAPTDTICHYGVLGMKWGVRRYQNPDGSFNAAGKRRYFSDGSGENYKPVKSAGGNARRALAKVYSVNEKYYSKRGNNVMSSMNKAAKEEMLKKASESDKKKMDKKIANEKAKNEKREAAAKAKSDRVDVSVAKNSATKRVAEDYHRLTELEFRGKYHTSKDKFAKRYQKTKGDTYSLGLKKQALAVAFLNASQGKSMTKTVADIAKYTALSKAEQRQLDKGHEKAAKIIETTANVSMFNDYTRKTLGI